ncbi:membrane protein insertion efficiency factor YidD [Patescibacteria group bacterium]|nr:membrane protein insertion efficiency factor YidD [Patescibacteria group bacterium]MBU4098613.1 membrane protein insertion efficiency factor YidD [Patescibacteria group bacterium]
MKKAAIISIIVYQNTISILLRQLIGVKAICRFTPSCSEYTKISIQKYGLKKGIKIGIIRLLHCQPLNSDFKDLVIWMRCKARARSAASRTNYVR